MKVAVASMGNVPEAWVGTRFGLCSQFLVFDLDTMEYVVVSIPPRHEEVDRVSLTAIRAVASQGVSAVITGHIKPVCRQALLDLGIQVIDGVEGYTVEEAIKRYKLSTLRTPEQRQGLPMRIAVASHGNTLDSRLDDRLGACTSFFVVDPQTKDYEIVSVEPTDLAEQVNLEIVRAVVRSGATVLIASEIHPQCCLALQALAVEVYLAPPDISVAEAVEQYQQGKLETSLLSNFGA